MATPPTRRPQMTECVYVFFGKSGVFAFDHNGNQQAASGRGITQRLGTSALPVLYQDLVVINASVESGSLVALDRATGKEKWRLCEISSARSHPVISRRLHPAGKKV